ncbi:DUF6770 family protein [Flavobacterium cerinum]|uniref:WG repeat-containing protein n=1 Tax=Flavobacterium cerinum TaxID=2502784 RepID=A0A3S3U5L6_9FLAO|nr:DUF6770 family protein [Flavobacterium cerinum]RWX03760.1 hypothetical protein EPI11_02175 [Flavobacterium cerinum]
MRNNYLLLLLCFFCCTSYGQITNLSKLSKGKFYSSDVIKDEKNNIKGYFILFESDKVAKETVELEYVVLDENLTKVTNGFMTEMKYESWLIDAEKITVGVSLYKNKLLLELADYANGVSLFQRYRILDVVTNEMSKPFDFIKGSLRLNPVFDRKNSNMSNNMSENISFYDGVGMMVHSKTLNKKEGRTKRYLAHYNDDLKEEWKYEYSEVEDKKKKILTYLASDEDVIVLFNRYTKNNNEGTYLPEVSTLFLDAKKGTLRKEFQFPELDKFSYRVVDCVITNDKVYLMGNYAKGNKYASLDDTENIGLYKLVFNKKTGELLDKNYFKWESLVGKLDIKKNGYVRKEGQLYTHNMLLKSDGNIIAVTEAFINKPIITNNMYFLELDDKFEVKDLFEVTKFRNKFPGTNAYSSDIKNYGMFDFIDYQDLGDDEFLFFLNDNEKKSKNRKKSTLYGIVSYSDGKFKRQTLDLKTETSNIKAYNSKKGYLMLVENFDEKNKSTEFRLEKINY